MMNEQKIAIQNFQRNSHPVQDKKKKVEVSLSLTYLNDSKDLLPLDGC